MTTITSAKSVLARRLIMPVALAGAVILAPALGVLTGLGAPTISADQSTSAHQSPNDRYWSVTGARVGAPSEQQVSQYGGSHKHLWVEQQLYGRGVVAVPNVDTTVHQSR